MKISVVIPVRVGENKTDNVGLYELNGKSLVRIAIEKFLDLSEIEDVYLDTNSDVVINSLADLIKRGLKIIKRPLELTLDNIKLDELITWQIHSVKQTDLLILSFITTPFASIDAITNVLQKFLIVEGSYDGFFTTIKVDSITYTNPILSNPLNEKENQFIYDAELLYGIKPSEFINNSNFFNNNLLSIEVEYLDALKIKRNTQLKFLEQLFNTFKGESD
jgi:CMP-N-acetylneuraminic acid synthetase